MKKDALLLMGGFISCKTPQYVVYARQIGLAVLVIDQKTKSSERQIAAKAKWEDHPLNLVDDFSFILPTALMAIHAQVEQWQKTYQIVGVGNLREFFVEPANIIAEMLDLPAPGLKTANVCRNKFLQRVYLKNYSPRFIGFKKNQIADFAADLFFPMVIKPTHLQGSIGVRQIPNRSAFDQNLEHYEEEDFLLMEEFIQGKDFSVESIVEKGEIIFTGITRKTTNNHEDSSAFVGIEYTIPAPTLAPKTKERLLEINSEILKRLDFKTGIAHIEYRVTAEGAIYFIEVGARNPGSGIVHLYQLAYGMHLENVLVELWTGRSLSQLKTQAIRVARNIYLPQTIGHLIGVRMDGDFDVEPYFFRQRYQRAHLPVPEKEDPPIVREIMIEKDHNEKLEALKDITERAVCVLMDAPDYQSLDALEQRVKEGVKVEVAPS